MRAALLHLHGLAQRAAVQSGRSMVDKQRGEIRQTLFKTDNQLTAHPFERVQWVVVLPQLRDPDPLRMRIERITDSAAQLDTDPRNRVRIIEIDAKDERARQADD